MHVMRGPLRALLVACFVAETVSAHAQSTAPDSAAIATAIAIAIRARIPSSGAERGAKVDLRPSSAFASAPWNLLVGRALGALDSTLIANPPTQFTTSVNVVRITVWTDSLIARIAFTTCRNTARGLMFGGTSYDYTFRRTDAKWTYGGDVMRGNGDGRCSAPRPTADYTGCYDLTVGPWAGSTFASPPQHVRVRLDSTVVPQLPNQPVVIREFATLAAPIADPWSALASMPRQHWYASDTAVHLTWGGTSQSLFIAMRARGDSLSGFMSRGSDYITKELVEARAPVSARRAVCTP